MTLKPLLTQGIKMRNNFYVVLLSLFVVACSPTVQVQAPDKPVEINLNVNIEHKIKVQIDKDVKKAITKNPDIF